MVHGGHAEDQIEALILVWEEQIGAQEIETLIRKVRPGGLDQIFASFDPNEPGLRRIEARRPETCAGTYFEGVERSSANVFFRCDCEPRPECRGLRGIHGLVETQL